MATRLIKGCRYYFDRYKIACGIYLGQVGPHKVCFKLIKNNDSLIKYSTFVDEFGDEIVPFGVICDTFTPYIRSHKKKKV